MITAGHLRTSIVGDYLNLAKPRTIFPHLITAASAMFLAAQGLPPGSTLFFTLVGGGLVASASNTLNCYLDRDLDKTMLRTRRRPLPSGRLRPNQALSFGITTGLVGLLILSQLVGLAAAALAVVALAYYILAYTLWFKRRTCWSSIIGSGVGAIPPLVGWVAVTDRIELTPLLLFAIVSLWTPPHFWSLAIVRRKEYELAGMEVLPARNAARWIIAFSLLLVSVTLLLVPAAGMGITYLTVASLLGFGFLNLAVRLQHRELAHGARHLYSYSTIYIAGLFLAMIADRLVR